MIAWRWRRARRTVGEQFEAQGGGELLLDFEACAKPGRGTEALALTRWVLDADAAMRATDCAARLMCRRVGPQHREKCLTGWRCIEAEMTTAATAHRLRRAATLAGPVARVFGADVERGARRA